MGSYSLNRSISIFVSLAGTFIHLTLAYKFSSLWPSLKSEPESEWEDSLHSWNGESLTVLWGLLSCYFAVDAVTSFVGFYGVLKNIKPFVRFCRDYSIADLFFVTFSAAFGAYFISTNPSFRTSLCEELPRQPDLLRTMTSMGFSLENCEIWLERFFFVFMTLAAIVIIIRLHFIVAISSYYSHITRDRSSNQPSRSMSRESVHRIYLLPPPSPSGHKDAFVYVPVPISTLSEQQVKQIQAVDASISHSVTSLARRLSYWHDQTNRAKLPVQADQPFVSVDEKV